jgi:hypothetical protein
MQKTIPIEYDQNEKVNGLAMMIGQYLEQNLEEFEEKNKQAKRLNITSTVEVEKGIVTTIRFTPATIFIRSGVSADTHLHLKSSYMLLADVLSGKTNPLKELFAGRIKLLKLSPVKFFSALRLLNFLKIPKELLQNEPKKSFITHERIVGFLVGAGCGFGIAYFLFRYGLL